MKMFPKMQDHTIDRLLRAHGGGSGKELPLCRDFDADLANAYVEHSLTSAETARYEQHLAACSPCRKTIVALTRMAQADEVTAPVDAAVRQAQPAPRVWRWLGALTAPQWAMAATAVVALAVALPLVLSHRGSQDEATVALNGSAASARAADSTANDPTQALASTPARANSADSPADSREPGAAARSAAPASEKPESNTEDHRTALAGAPASSDSGATSTASQPATPPATEQVIAKTETQPQAGVSTPAETPAGEAPPLPKIDEKEARQLPEDKDAAKATTLKPGQAGGEERAKAEGMVQADTIAPPPPPPTRSAEPDRARRRDDRVASGPAASAFQPPSEAVRGPSRRVNNHLFWLRGDVWTDKDYNPHKDMPMVTVIYDSEVYRDLLAKDAKIKPFLTGFPADARVIFIFKGTAYKLIPQDGDR